MEELQVVGAKLFWNEKEIWYIKFVVLSVNKDDENVKIFNQKRLEF